MSAWGWPPGDRNPPEAHTEQADPAQTSSQFWRPELSPTCEFQVDRNFFAVTVWKLIVETTHCLPEIQTLQATLILVPFCSLGQVPTIEATRPWLGRDGTGARRPQPAWSDRRMRRLPLAIVGKGARPGRCPAVCPSPRPWQARPVCPRLVPQPWHRVTAEAGRTRLCLHRERGVWPQPARPRPGASARTPPEGPRPPGPGRPGGQGGSCPGPGRRRERGGGRAVAGFRWPVGPQQRGGSRAGAGPGRPARGGSRGPARLGQRLPTCLCMAGACGPVGPWSHAPQQPGGAAKEPWGVRGVLQPHSGVPHCHTQGCQPLAGLTANTAAGGRAVYAVVTLAVATSRRRG